VLDPDKLEALLRRALPGVTYRSSVDGRLRTDVFREHHINAVVEQVLAENARGAQPSTPEAPASHPRSSK